MVPEWLHALQHTALTTTYCTHYNILMHTVAYRCCGRTTAGTATPCNTPHSNPPHYNTLQHTATHCNTLQHTILKQIEAHCSVSILWQNNCTHCNTLQHTTTRCNTLQHTATHCNTLQHTTTRCNTLQHTATHCNTLRHTAAYRYDGRTTAWRLACSRVS